MHVVATAGHVDHGKSTLVRALTGMEPDRWAEERRRGMTIDLGFAWTDLPSGETVAFVDVPGHHRFVGNMLAGVGPVPAVMVVVAADEGWARQSGEHLAAIDALGVRHGLLVVTRSDLADPAAAVEEASARIAESSLGAVEAVAVSGATGAGLDGLLAALDRLVARLPRPSASARVRLWVDRAFTIRGSGTVVTGTLGAGRLSVGDELELAPAGRLVRVRGLESLKHRAGTVDAVARVAVNLRGVELDEVHRGSALVTPGLFATTTVVDVRLAGGEAVRLPGEPMLHVGSAAVAVRARPLGAATARLALAAPLPLQVGDRAILRDPGAGRVLAGVTVLDAAPPALRRRGAATARARQLAGMSAAPDPAAEVERRGAVPLHRLVEIGALAPGDPPPDGAVVAGEWAVSPVRWRQWQADLVAAADRRAAAEPLAPGLPREAARHALGLPDVRLLDALVAAAGELVSDADGIHRPGLVRRLPPPVAAAVDALRARLAEAPFAAAEAAELARLGLTERHLAAAVRVGLLVRVGDGVHLLPTAYDEALRRLAALGDAFTTSEARQALDTTRRVAVPLLEALDAMGRTRRLDANRRVVVALEASAG
ncbi:MAG: selenocysteine-specific translation elongation factor [Frankiaceae bacterium]